VVGFENFHQIELDVRQLLFQTENLAVTGVEQGAGTGVRLLLPGGVAGREFESPAGERFELQRGETRDEENQERDFHARRNGISEALRKTTFFRHFGSGVRARVSVCGTVLSGLMQFA